MIMKRREVAPVQTVLSVSNETLNIKLQIYVIVEKLFGCNVFLCAKIGFPFDVDVVPCHSIEWTRRAEFLQAKATRR